MNLSRTHLVALSASLGALAGAAASAAVALKYFEKKYREISDEEIAEAKEFYQRTYKVGEFATPQLAAKALGVEEHLMIDAAEALERYQSREPEAPAAPEGTHEISKNVFTDVDVDDEFDPAMQERDPAFPYVISYEEFREGAEEFNQVTMTYYEPDGVLTDDRDDVVEDEDAMVGDENLTKFGVGSQDHNIVYVRNERLELDMCIEKSRNSYATHVAGLTLEHSDGPRIRRFRTYDD